MMIDREKVIKAIEICYTSGHNCTECPLFSKDDCNDELMYNVLALLKEQEPRVMTVKELEETEELVFIELKTNGDDDKVLTCFGLLSEWDNLAFHFIIDKWLLDGKPFFRIYGCELKRKEYNIQWRPWNKRPTIKQMEATSWEN